MDKLLASAIKYKEHLVQLEQVIENRLASFDRSALIPSLFDIVPAAMLPYLAKQWGVDGYNGWRYATTEQEKRDLLKRAIPINKTKGTEYGIREALKMINIDPIEIVKGEYFLYCDGEQYTGGSFLCGDSNPFVMQIQITQADYPSISAQTAIDMAAIILTFKAARDYLVSVNYKQDDQNDSMGLSDTLSIDDGSTVTVL